MSQFTVIGIPGERLTEIVNISFIVTLWFSYMKK